MATSNAFYFPHDMDAVSDPKLQSVLRVRGMEGIGAYWCLLERLYRQNGVLFLSEIPDMAWSLHCEESLLESILKDFGLFEIHGNEATSRSASERILKREERIRKNKEAGSLGGKTTQSKRSASAGTDASQMRDESQANAQADAQANAQADAQAGKERKGIDAGVRDNEHSVGKKKKEIDYSFVEEELRELFKEFVKMRKEIGHPIKTQRGAEARYETLSRLSGGRIELAKKIIQQSLDKEWEDFYEIKDSKGNGTINRSSHRGSDSGYVPDYSNTEF